MNLVGKDITLNLIMSLLIKIINLRIKGRSIEYNKIMLLKLLKEFLQHVKKMINVHHGNYLLKKYNMIPKNKS